MRPICLRLDLALAAILPGVLVVFHLAAANPASAANASWNNPAGGVWSNPANWSTGVVPGSSDQASITLAGSYTVTLDANANVAGLTIGGGTGQQTLAAVSKTITSSGTILVATSGLLDISSCTINGALQNQGVLVTRQSVTALNGAVTNQSGASWRVEGGTGGSATVTLGAAATNHGTLDLTCVSAAQATLAGSGTLTNASDGLIRVLPGAGSERHLSAPLDNQGTITVSYPLYVDNSGVSYLNESGATIQANDDIIVSQSGTSASFTNQGTINLAASHTLSVTGRTFANSGTVAGGTLSLNSLTANLSTINGAGTTTVVTNCTINGSLQNQGTLVTRQICPVNATVTNQSSASWRVEGGTGGSAMVTLGASVTNHGTLDLTAVNPAQAILAGSGTLTNASDGLIRVLAGAGSERHLSAPLDNQGTVTVSWPLYIDNTGASTLNELGATIQANDDIVVTQSGTSAGFTNQGTITVAGGHTLNVTGKTFSNSGTISGGGSLSLANLTATLSTAQGASLATVTVTNSTVSAPQGVVNGAGNTLVLAASTLNGTLENQGTLVTRLSVTSISGAVTNQAGASWRVEGGTGGSAMVTLGAGATNHGTLDLTSVLAAQAILGGSGTLTNASDGLIRVLPGAGSERHLQMTLLNQGTVSIQYPLYLDTNGLDHLNDVGGTIVLDQDIVLAQSGVTPSFTNRGTVTVNAGHTFTISNGTFLNDVGGTIRGAGTIAITGTDLANAGLISPGTSPGKLTVNGRIVQNATGRIRVELSGTQAVTQYDLLSDNGQMVLGGTLEIALLQGFVPPAGSAYIPIKYTTHTGTFSAYQGLDLGGNLQFVPTYTDSGLILSTGSFAIVNVTANHGGNSGVASIIVHGVGLFPGLTCWLARGAQQISGTNLHVDPDGTAFSVRFDLTNAALGAWDVVVRAADGTTVTLPGGFTVETVSPAKIAVYIVGRGQIRVGQPSSFDIVYYNTGNVDALCVQIGIGGIPAGAGWGLAPPLANPPSVPGATPVDVSHAPIAYGTPTDSTVMLLVPRIPPGLEQRFTLTVHPVTTTPFHLSAWSNPPYFHSPPSPELSLCILQMMSMIIDCGSLFLPELGCFQAIRAFYFSLALSTAENGFELAVDPPDGLLSRACSLIQFIGTNELGAVQVAADCGGLVIPELQIWSIIQCLLGEIDTAKDCDKAFMHEGQGDLDVSPVVSHDPNEKAGPSGVGVQRFVRGTDPMPYAIYFENAAGATAPAAVVAVADTLDTTKVDVSTVALGPIRFGSHVITPPPGSSAFLGTLDLRPSTNLIVKVDARRDVATGVLTWRLSSIDPDTGAPPLDPTAGFLPPNLAPPQGEGYVQYTVMPKSTLTTGQVVANRASIVFDANAPILTPTWANAIDATPPVSAVTPLPTETDTLAFRVNWGGSDIGSGLRDFTIHVSTDAGPDSVWLAGVSYTTALFVGQGGHTYTFYSVARDSALREEVAPPQPDAQTTIPSTVGVGRERKFVFALRGTWPNPGDARARVFFELPSWMPAELDLFDVTGRRMAHRDVGSMGPGAHSVNLGDGTPIKAGVYFVRLHQGRQSSIKKIIVSR
jgi:hypothetical protein